MAFVDLILCCPQHARLASLVYIQAARVPQAHMSDTLALLASFVVGREIGNHNRPIETIPM
jgi:hypothetical protein